MKVYTLRLFIEKHQHVYTLMFGSSIKELESLLLQIFNRFHFMLIIQETLP